VTPRGKELAGPVIHRWLKKPIPAWWAMPVILLVAFIYVLNAWTPSHYQQAAQILGLTDVRPVFGKSRPVRSDEWSVATPYFQIAVASDLGPIDRISPYHEPLKTYFALPSRDWSMAFKPDLWGFLVLDPAHAYSLHFALLALASLFGAILLLRQLGCGAGVALAVSAMLFLSQFVQVWWTSSAPALGLSLWPAVAYLWPVRWWWRLPALTCVVAVWLIGQIYPPLVVSTGLACAFAIAAFRPDALRPGRLIPAALAAGAGGAIAWLHYADLIPILSATVYPGQRVADGGGVAPLQLAAHLLPSLVTQRFEPIALWPTNACEIAVVGSFLPLAMACFCDHRAVARWMAGRRWAVAVWSAGLLVMLAWMLLPIPGRFAPILNLTPPSRMLWGFGLLLTMGLAVIADGASWTLTRARVAVFTCVVAAAWAASKLVLSHAPLEPDRFDLVIIPVLLLLLALRGLAPQALPPRRLALSAVALTTAITFGGFNPIQSAVPIFAPQKSAVLDTFAAYAKANPKGWVIALGMYGSTINGAGAPAINHTLLQPQLGVFRAAYPDLDRKTLNGVFNRYAHIMPAIAWSPSLALADVAAAPPDPFAIPLPADVEARVTGAQGPERGGVEQVAVVQLGPRRWGVTAGGWSDWSGVRPDQRLRVSLDESVGRILKATAFRLPRPDIVAKLGDPALFAAGFGLRLEVETPAISTTFPAQRIQVAAVGGRGGALALPMAAARPEAAVAVTWPQRAGAR